MLVKRGMDIVGSALGLVIGALPLAVMCLVVRITMGSPVLFRHMRPGRNGVPFTLYKVRTMRKGPGTDAERLTRIGTFLRSTSLDELPELWNVLRGDMSLVGPRPLLTQYLEHYDAHQARRHEVRPGLTGLAQVEGRNALTWEDRFALDVEYVDTRTLGLDLRIIGRTVGAVLSREGISAPGHATMPNFGEPDPTATIVAPGRSGGKGDGE